MGLNVVHNKRGYFDEEVLSMTFERGQVYLPPFPKQYIYI